MKKGISLLLAFILVLSSVVSLSATASADEGEQPYDELSFCVVDENGFTYVEYPEGAAYDSESNTLTLTDFHHPELRLKLSGCKKKFTLIIVGECELDYLWFPQAEADILIDGTGTLTVNQGARHYSAIYAYNNYNRFTGSSFAVKFGKNVKLHLYGEESGQGNSHVAFLQGNTGGIVFENGKNYDNYTASIYEHDTEEYVNLFQYYEGDGRRHGYQLTCASDPDGIYAVRINDYADPPSYHISKYYTIEGYDGYGQISSFGEYGELQMTQEEFLKSDYSFIYEDDYVRIPFVYDDWREWRGNKVVDTENPLDPKKETYCADISDFYYDEDRQLVPESYNIYLLTWSKEENAYILNWDAVMNPVKRDMSVEEFNDSSYYFETGEGSLQKEYTTASRILCLYDKKDAEKVANTGGYKVTNKNHPEQVYACYFDYDEYFDDDNFTIKGYHLYPVVYDEEINCFMYRGGYESLTKEEFEQQGYQLPVEPTKKKELESNNSWGLSSSKLYVDRKGNRYVKDSRRVDGEWVTGYCPISDDSFVFIPAEYVNYSGSETYYIPGDFVDIDPDELTTVPKHVVTDQWNCEITGTEFFYNFDESEPIILGDSDGDGNVTILDATGIQRHLASLTTTSFNENAADVDQDNKVTILDATAIQRHLADLPTNAKGIGEEIKA